MTLTERNRRLSEAARLIEEAAPGVFGSVQFNLQDGKVRNFDVRETVRVEAGRRSAATPFGVPPEEDGSIAV